MTQTPILDLDEWEEAQAEPHIVVNEAHRWLECFAQLSVKSQTTNSPPGSPADGDRYIVPATATGVWAGHGKQVALYLANAWDFRDAPVGALAYVEDTASIVRFLAGAWGPDSSSAPYALQVACSDLATDITTGANKAYARAHRAFTLTGVRASVLVAGAGITVDVNKNGVSVLSTKLSIDSAEKTSVTAAVPAVISTPNFADDDEITIDVDAVGAGVKGLVVTLLGA